MAPTFNSRFKSVTNTGVKGSYSLTMIVMLSSIGKNAQGQGWDKLTKNSLIKNAAETKNIDLILI
jgi:hypothetical protein